MGTAREAPGLRPEIGWVEARFDEDERYATPGARVGELAGARLPVEPISRPSTGAAGIPQAETVARSRLLAMRSGAAFGASGVGRAA